MATDKHIPDISEKLALLRQQYFSQLPEKIASLEKIWGQLTLNNSEQISVINDLYHHVHSMHGSAGTFGAIQLSQTAKDFDQFLKSIIDYEQNISTSERDVIERFINMIKEQAAIADTLADKEVVSTQSN